MGFINAYKEQLELLASAYGLIQDECDLTIAIDVSARKDKFDNVTPPSYEILFSAFQIMQNSIVEEKLKRTKPDILITTNIKDVRVHEFMKAKSIYYFYAL